MKRLLVRRRARNDLAQVVTIATLVAAATALGIVGPGLVLDTLDEGAREAVASVGSNADVVASAIVGAPISGVPMTSPRGMIELGESMPSELPEGLASVFVSSTLTVISSDTGVRRIDDASWMGEGDLALQIAMLTDENTEAITLVEGRLPDIRDVTSLEPVEVVLSRANADASGVTLGQLLAVGSPLAAPNAEELEFGAQPKQVPEVLVVGIVEPLDSADPLWSDSPELWAADERPATPSAQMQLRFTVLAAPDGVLAASNFLEYPFNGFVRMRIDPQLFTEPLASSVVAEANLLRANAQVLAPQSVGSFSVQTAIPEALADYPRLARAALAQMSVMMSGVIGIAAVVLVLLSRLLVAQRSAAIALERARGASVLSVGLRALIESAIVTAVGVTIGSISALITSTRDPLPVVVVVVVALLASPLQSMIYARRLWTGQREPANRRDRQLRARRSRSQRLVAELAIVAIAAAALVSLRGRGLLQNRSGGIDPLLALAPLLLAIAVTLVVIRVYPYPVRAIGAAAQRTRGPLGLLGSVRARSAIATLPLLALTLGSALAVSGTLLVDTVRHGQAEASWQRVGADARVSAELDDAEIELLRLAPGVDAASATRARGSVGLDLGTTSTTVTVIAVDSSYADVVDAQPDQPSTDTLRELGATPTTGEALSIVVDDETARQLISDDFAMYYGPKYVPVHVIGVSSVRPEGYLSGPFAYIDIDAIAPLMPESYGANSILLVGPGSDAAAADLPKDSVLTRSGWTDERRQLALVSGVQETMIFSIAAVGLLAIVALVATVISGARARGRALALLRTLGMQPRLGWWLALAELAPVVVTAVLGGIGAGIAVVLVLAPSLGLDVLAGGITIPAASFSPWVFAGLAVAALVLLLLGALADVLVHRRDKLSELLRVGETA